jgi:phosphoenolpyruvate phosphomutase
LRIVRLRRRCLQLLTAQPESPPVTSRRPAAASFKEVLGGSGPARILGVYDGLSARLAEHAGADALWASGLCIAASQSLPDGEIPTYDSVLNRLADIRRGTRLPILVDGNAGFGDEQVVAHVVRRFEEAGAQGVCIEDKAYPRANSFAHSGAFDLARPEEFAVKVHEAACARSDPGFAVFARAEGLIVGLDVDEVLLRARLYSEAGADAVVVHSNAITGSEVVEFARRWSETTPLAVIPTTYPSFSLRAARRAGVHAVIYANQVMRVAVQAMQAFLTEAMQQESLKDCQTPMTPLLEFLNFNEVLTTGQSSGQIREKFVARLRSLRDERAP